MIDIAIIGSGPAGMTAGLYAARNGLKTVLFEQAIPGGQAGIILNIENYPGFDEGISGVDLVMRMSAQAERFGLETVNEAVLELKPHGAVKQLVTESKTYEARTVIIATGAQPRKLGLQREQELTGRGVSYCATCDGAFFREKTVAIAGGGNTALTDALILANYAKHIYLIHRRDRFRATAALIESVKREPKVEIITPANVIALLGDNKLSGMKIRYLNDTQKELETDALFVAIGVTPNSQFLGQALSLNEQGAIITDEQLQTSVPGIFAAGDCRTTPLRQIITAAADGALAATYASNYLRI